MKMRKLYVTLKVRAGKVTCSKCTWLRIWEDGGASCRLFEQDLKERSGKYIRRCQECIDADRGE